MQIIELMKKYHKFCDTNNLSVWNFDNTAKGISLMSGSLPVFDFKLMKKLMDNQLMASSVANLGPLQDLGTIESLKRRSQLH
jgi:hypothetical protein|tara:strand:- start:80 stop:325 length:246 start_codon:yes stop_codon:yes gene_type:complete